jgi:hypothetical protein
MSIAKVPSARGKTNHQPPAVAPQLAGAADEWFEPETTQVDARLEDRSDWARPADPNAKQAIEKMVEEVLVDVPVSPIEDHRAGSPAAAPPAVRRGTAAVDLSAPARGGRKMIFAVAGIVAVLAAVWLAVQTNLVRF